MARKCYFSIIVEGKSQGFIEILWYKDSKEKDMPIPLINHCTEKESVKIKINNELVTLPKTTLKLNRALFKNVDSEVAEILIKCCCDNVEIAKQGESELKDFINGKGRYDRSDDVLMRTKIKYAANRFGKEKLQVLYLVTTYLMEDITGQATRKLLTELEDRIYTTRRK